MNKNLLFDCLELNNFRSYSNSKIGPFKRFNLIYGKNGTGKTSLIEAIEIVLSGKSTRIQVDSDIFKVIAADENRDVSIILYKANKKLTEFNSINSRRFNPKKVLKKLFKIVASSQKARSLLPTLLRIHNFLFSERIIKFLEADKREKLQESMNEMITGRDTMKLWGYIEEARNIIKRLNNNCQKEIDSLDIKKRKIEKEINQLHIDSKQDTELKWKKFLKESDPLIYNVTGIQKKDDLPTIDNFRIYDAKIREAKNYWEDLFIQLNDYQAGKYQSAKDLKQESIQKNETLSETEQRIKEYENKIKFEEQENAELDTKQLHLEADLKHNNELLEKLSSLKKSVSFIIEWLPEISAANRTEKLNSKKCQILTHIEYLENASELVQKLPTKKTVENTNYMYDSSKNMLPEITKNLEEKLEINDNTKAELARIRDKLDQFQNKNDKVNKCFLELHVILKQYLKLTSSKQCPSCGTEFDSKKKLSDAIKKTKMNIKDLIKTHSISDLIEEEKTLNKILSEKQDEISNLNSQISELKKQYMKAEQTINTYKMLVDECEIAFKQAKLKIVDNSAQLLINRLKYLKYEKVKKATEQTREELLHVKIKISNEWINLRQESYLEQIDIIKNIITAIPDQCNKLDISPPKKIEYESYNQLLLSITNLYEQANKKAEHFIKLQKEYEKQHIKNKEEIISIKLKLSEAMGIYEKRKKEYKELKSLVEKLNKVIDIGIIKESEKIDQKKTINILDNIILSFSVFMQEIIQREADNKLMQEKQKDILSLQQQKTYQAEILSKLNLYQPKMENLQSPQDYTLTVFKENENTINTFFSNLHWPLDFEKIMFEQIEGKFDITVSPIIKESRCPAHHQLSAGQRTALAISIFWTMNIAFATIPNIMIMDEPIQNIDELNILNFLDGLRWFVEETDRQVFISTASQRIESLILKKFGYLKENFIELSLHRISGNTKVNYLNWEGRKIRSETDGIDAIA